MTLYFALVNLIALYILNSTLYRKRTMETDKYLKHAVAAYLGLMIGLSGVLAVRLFASKEPEKSCYFVELTDDGKFGWVIKRRTFFSILSVLSYHVDNNEPPAHERGDDRVYESRARAEERFRDLSLPLCDDYELKTPARRDTGWPRVP